MFDFLQSHYSFTVKAVTPAPRGFWAETFYLDTDKDVYFLKIQRNYPWKSELTESLRVQNALAESVDFIPKPILTSDGSCCTEYEGGIAAVYTLVNGETHIERDACMIMRTMADIYKSDIKCANVYKYKLYAVDIIESLKFGSLDIKSAALGNYLNRNRELYLSHFGKYAELYEYARSRERAQYLTHGDIAKNLMRGEDGKIFVIDWDRIRMGTIELDLSEFADVDTDIGRLNKIAAEAGLEWHFDGRLHDYFILNKLFYNLRNLVASDDGNLTEENVNSYQGYLDSLDKKLL